MIIVTLLQANENKDAGSELYSEIDNQTTTETYRNPQNTLQVPVAQAEDPYAEIDVDTSKGEQTDSAGYAVVRDLNGLNGRPQNPQLHIDDDDDYAVCDVPPQQTNSIVMNGERSQSAENLLGATAAVDLDDDYAVINNNRDKSAKQESAAQASSSRGASASSSLPNGHRDPAAVNGEKPFQKYKRREHVYQEIDEVKNQVFKSPSKDKKQ